MSEAIIVRGGKGVSGGQVDLSGINANIADLWERVNDIYANSGVPVYQDRCSILVTVKDSAGVPINDLSVHCLDGSIWYNYHTNANGQCLFMSNSGSANITAWNFSINGDYKWLDQNYTVQNIDAPVGVRKDINMQLPKINGMVNYTGIGNIYTSLYNTSRFRVTTSISNLFLGAGGGGGEGTNIGMTSGGGGGGATVIQSVNVLPNISFNNYYIGEGGKGGDGGSDEVDGSGSSGIGGTGGTTSAFGYSAYGGTGGSGWGDIGGRGGSGTYFGGNGATRRYVGENSECSNWGGGGASGNKAGGSPYGASKPTRNNFGRDGTNGGGGSGVNVHYTARSGGFGGGGKISFVIP